jgi:hypothetical protein
MTYPNYIRDKAIQMRVERDMTLDEIVERLALPRGTVYSWIRHVPLQRERNWGPAQFAAAAANKSKWQTWRDERYAEGVAEWPELIRRPTFREFVALYIAEGSKRNRNTVSIANSDAVVMSLATCWMRRLTTKRVHFSLQYHADQDLDELREFWSTTLGVAGDEIRMQRKSNSNQLSGRTWRSVHGVISAHANDTAFRARLQAWIDLIHLEWRLDSAA